MGELVQYTVTDRVAVVTINNPPVNALSPDVWEGIDAAVARASVDPAADAIVLIGAGATFIAGADIKVFDTLNTREDSLARSAKTHAMLKRVEDTPKPLVAAIHGNALGGGLEVAQACHFRVAAKDAKVGQPEVLLGIIPGAGGTQRLPRLCGAQLALEMCTDGKPVPASKAKAAGILDEVLPGRDPSTGSASSRASSRDEGVNRTELLTAAVAFAKSKAQARTMRKTRDIALSPEQIKNGIEACRAMRQTLAKTAKGARAPLAAVDAIEEGLRLGF